MCNEYQLKLNRGASDVTFREIKIPFAWADAEPNRDLADPYRPTNRAPMIRPVDPANPMAGLEGVERRWWLIPHFHRGPVSAWKSMCTNARIETVDTAPTFREAYRKRRALIPLTSFIEYDAPPGWKKGQPKRRWEITWEPQGPLDQVRFFAGIWDESRPDDMDGPVESFAFITGPNGPDVAAIHDRQPVVLTLEQGLEWLTRDGQGKAGLQTDRPVGTYQLKESPRASIISREMRLAL